MLLQHLQLLYFCVIFGTVANRQNVFAGDVYISTLHSLRFAENSLLFIYFSRPPTPFTVYLLKVCMLLQINVGFKNVITRKFKPNEISSFLCGLHGLHESLTLKYSKYLVSLHGSFTLIFKNIDQTMDIHFESSW